jgi:hypothetical protein
MFIVTTSPTLASGTATVVGTTLTDGTATFTTDGILPGCTVVLGVTPNFDRRQVVSVISNTQLGLDANGTGGTYRVVKSLNTFGTTTGLYADLVDATDTEERVLLTNGPPVPSQIASIGDFFSQVFNTPFGGSSGSTAGTTTFTDTTKDFFNEDVGSGDYLYIPSGPERGVYRIVSILAATQLEVATPFPGTTSGISYQVRRTALVSEATLQDVFSVYVSALDALAAVQAWKTTSETTVPVNGDAQAHALGWFSSDLTTRASAGITRLNDVVTNTASLEGVLSAGDRLYDRRFVWIDARINQETGIVVRRTRATANRIKAQDETAKELIKLLTT